MAGRRLAAWGVAVAIGLAWYKHDTRTKVDKVKAGAQGSGLSDAEAKEWNRKILADQAAKLTAAKAKEVPPK